MLSSYIRTFYSTGNVQTFTTPTTLNGGFLRIIAYGAQGTGGTLAGLGATVAANITAKPGQVFKLYVGNQKGFNGGGSVPAVWQSWAGSGGGASDVRVGPGFTLNKRILVAGGGGGAFLAYGGATGGSGGYPSGSSSQSHTTVGGGVGSGGGTQTSGGSAGYCTSCNGLFYGSTGSFGQGGNSNQQQVGGGGGGGWYGGGGGAEQAGGGGSSYVNSTYLVSGVANTAFSNGVVTGNGSITIQLFCAVGYYMSSWGVCNQCPMYSTTKATGATSLKQCGIFIYDHS